MQAALFSFGAMCMDRRNFLKGSLSALAAVQTRSVLAAAKANPPVFTTTNQRWQSTYDAALRVLAGNVQVLPRFDLPVLIEGSTYRGVWQECGPHESLVYRKFGPDVARNSHRTFFALQKPDGQLPANNKTTETGYGQIQMVVPIAATAWELARAAKDEALLAEAYRACSAWDAWLLKYRNTRGTGLTEGFCTYDTGNDNSPRWAGVSNRCPDSDAKKVPLSPGVPRLCPDLSATTYGARMALSAMARELGKSDEAEDWAERAEFIRGLILRKLYVSEDAAFFDFDSDGKFVKVRSEIITRVCSEHVLNQRLFDDLWTRQIHRPEAFWPPYPLPSVALDDPQFVRPIPRNSWGGASQALTALRASRWMDHYGRSAEYGELLLSWCEAIQRDPTFRQQIDPLTGEFTQTDAPGYSPCALVMVDSTWRIAGIHEEPETLQWNVRPACAAAQGAHFTLHTDEGRRAEMLYGAQETMLKLNGKLIAKVAGGAARIVTRKDGTAFELVAIETQSQAVTLHVLGHLLRHFRLDSNQRIRPGCC